MCSEDGCQLDASLLAELEETNRKDLEKLEEKIEDTVKNFGETEQREALMAKAEYLCRVGDKVGGWGGDGRTGGCGIQGKEEKG